MGPVHSPAAVTIPLQKTQQTKKQHPQQQNTQNQNQTKNKHQKRKEESDRRSSSVTSDEKEVIALYQLRYWYGKTMIKREHRDTKITLPYRRVSEATQHYAETRDPPSQDPRDHIEQAIKA